MRHANGSGSRRAGARTAEWIPSATPGQDFRDLEERQRQRREKYERALRTGAAELRRVRRAALARRQGMLASLATLHRRLAQLRADLGRL